MKRLITFFGLFLCSALVLFAQDAPATVDDAMTAAAAASSSANTAWMLISTALVFLMTPGLAFFYGGLVRSKNALNTMMMSFISMGIVLVTWMVIGFSLAFGVGNPYIGDFSMAMLNGIGLENEGILGINSLLFFAFQGAFIVITAALISGSIVERMRFSAYALFIVLWSVVVYAPVCHWIWGGGFLGAAGAMDFAGGTVIHINAATAAVVAALVLGKRKSYGRQAFLPHNVPFVLLGTGLLWFGWFGFNGGSALAAGNSAILACLNTMLAPAATLAVWAGLDHLRSKQVTAVGTATAIVVGLVVITPAAGFVSPVSAVIMGAIGAVCSYYAIVWRTKTKLDDSLDVLAAHGIGGLVGALLTGVFAQKVWGGLSDGALFGNPMQLWIQAEGALITIAYSAIVTYILLKLINLIIPIRANEKEEALGLDVVLHGEEAYSDGEGAILLSENDLIEADNVREALISEYRTGDGSTASEVGLKVNQ